MKNIAILSTIGIVILFTITSSGYSASLEGRIEQFGPLGIVAAPFLPLTLYSETKSQNIKTVNSGSDGRYYFADIKPGDYILKIWVMGFNKNSIDYRVHLLNQESTLIEPKIIHFIQFNIIPPGNVYMSTTLLRAEGTHYSLPDDTFLWVLLSDKKNNFYFCDDDPVVIKKNGTWKKLKSFQASSNDITKINVVIVTKEANDIFKERSRSELPYWYGKLPKGTFILASQDIKVRGGSKTICFTPNLE